MPTETFCRFFETELEAEDFMRMRNRAYEAAGNHRDMVVVVVGPEGPTGGPGKKNWGVVDLKAAIELGGGYRWTV